MGLTLAIVAVNTSVSGLGAEWTMPLLGAWAAKLDIPSRPTLLRLLVTETPTHNYVAVASLEPAVNGLGSGINLNVETDKAHWSLTKAPVQDQFRLDIRKKGYSLTIAYSIGATMGSAPLRRLSDDLQRNGGYAGTYVLPSGDNIYIRTAKAFPDTALTYLEEKTGKRRILYSVTANSFVAGPSFALPDPVGIKLAFRGEPAGSLSWRASSKKDLIAKKSTAYWREDVRIETSGATLGCEALIPAGVGKHPGVVLVPGSGGVDRFGDYYIMADVFAQLGIASLTCDKRGTGVSTGDWYSQSFQEQAEDVMTGMRYLRQRVEVDPAKVGVWAFSQGTYPAPIAALGGKASFLILVAAFAIPLRESVMITRAERMRRSGTSSEDIGRFRQHFERLQQAIMDNDFQSAKAAYQACACPSFPNVPPSEEAWNSSRSNLRARLMWSYNPGSVLRSLDMPVLALWGSGDLEALASAHKPVLEQALRQAGNTDYTLRVIEGADHGLWLDVPSIQQTGYAPEYIAGMLDWLRTRVVTKAGH